MTVVVQSLSLVDYCCLVPLGFGDDEVAAGLTTRSECVHTASNFTPSPGPSRFNVLHCGTLLLQVEAVISLPRLVVLRNASLALVARCAAIFWLDIMGLSESNSPIGIFWDGASHFHPTTNTKHSVLQGDYGDR